MIILLDNIQNAFLKNTQFFLKIVNLGNKLDNGLIIITNTTLHQEISQSICLSI